MRDTPRKNRRERRSSGRSGSFGAQRGRSQGSGSGRSGSFEARRGRDRDSSDSGRFGSPRARQGRDSDSGRFGKSERFGRPNKFGRSDRSDRSGRREGSRLEMHEVVCDKCGRECTVPFKPTSSKPVYCSDCFKKNEAQGGRSGSADLVRINEKLDKILKALNID